MPIETLRDLADLYLSSGLEPTGKSQDKLSKIQEEFSRRKGEIAKVIRDKLGLSLDPIEEQIAGGVELPKEAIVLAEQMREGIMIVLY